MRDFTRLYLELDRATRTGEKLDALRRYFQQAQPLDAVWALSLLLGRTNIRAISRKLLRTWAIEESGLPAWLVDECDKAVGGLSELIALLLPDPIEPSPEPLHRVVTEHLLPLGTLAVEAQRTIVTNSWREFTCDQRLCFQKLITGRFHAGSSRKHITRALAEATGIHQAVVAHRLGGKWTASAEDYRALLHPDAAANDITPPYPFCLADPLEGEAAALGDIRAWQIEWKWAGIRCQLIRRRNQIVLWSDGDELLTDSVPEIRDAAAHLPDGCVLDGAILAWEGEAPLGLSALEERVNRKQAEGRLFAEVPVVFTACDLLEADSRDIRVRPQYDRRAALERLLTTMPPGFPIRLSTILSPPTWHDADALRAVADRRSVNGLMLRRCASAYSAGSSGGDWREWRLNPLTIDAVLLSVRSGDGRRTDSLTDYTFGVWDEGRLVPLARADFGLTDEEIADVDRFIKANTIERHGPVRIVRPHLVFELAFDAVLKSRRHASGLALRFPRISRWRRDKEVTRADSLADLRRRFS